MPHTLPTRRALLAGAAAVTTAALTLRPEPSSAAPVPRRNWSQDPVRLFSNENRYGPCEGALRVMRESPHLASRYVSQTRVDALKRAIAELEGLTPEHVLITAGSFEALVLLANEFGAGGGGVICPDPSFPVVATFAERAGGKVQRVPLDATMTHDLDALAARVDANTKLVSVCNPNNPTGTVVDSARLRSFCEAMASRATVLVDEVYIHYLEPAPGLSMVDLVRAGKDVIVTRSFSKIHGLAGMRMGYTLAQPALVKKLDSRQMTLPNPLAVEAALASLQDKAFVPRMRKLTTDARRITTKALDAAGLKPVPAHANFVWMPLPPELLDLPGRFIPHGFHLTTRPHVPIAPEIACLRLTVGTVEEMTAFATLLPSLLGR
ncbi:histidinol-phosphate aminotransferase family protein [Myxococcus sp. K38C18041901]|uniref:pyridoxal phosphate-dependent aminotransferase n=1 Tax=Myxococcus guangdongensis TaxID=2906760 RepID=UPI0020A79641|nr:aminotransferase class I/II-fold pyridoxal phosphate-dependent enzyme [Myxococcus guangdongensis]MCP3065075.1 histidinol-phosphate aminotransferase family protein [Myxococcus guangdongensis]